MFLQCRLACPSWARSKTPRGGEARTSWLSFSLSFLSGRFVPPAFSRLGLAAVSYRSAHRTRLPFLIQNINLQSPALGVPFLSLCLGLLDAALIPRTHLHPQYIIPIVIGNIIVVGAIVAVVLLTK